MRRVAILVVFAMAVGGCTRLPASSVSIEPSIAPADSPVAASARPTALAEASVESLPSDLPAAIRHAIEMRHGMGLRDDLDYVLQAARDPAATSTLFDFPLYPAEESKVFKDQADQAAVGEAIRTYAARHPDEFGGYYIDRRDMPGVVVALWTNHLDSHAAAIRSRIGDIELFAVRMVRYTEKELRAIQDRVSADWRADWIARIPARVEGVGVETIENYVSVEISSANPNAEAVIEAHYGLGDRLRVQSDGTGVALVRWGTIKGTVLRPDGSRFRPRFGAELSWGAPGDALGSCGGGDVGFAVTQRGTFKIPCQVGRRTIFVLLATPSDTWRTVGQGTAVVRDGKTTTMTITLTEDPTT